MYAMLSALDRHHKHVGHHAQIIAAHGITVRPIVKSANNGM